MPTYIYEAAEDAGGCPHCNLGFEVRHGIGDASPEACPRCGGPVRKRLTAPRLNLRWNEKSQLSDANLKRHGFKKLRNEGDGKFRVT